VLGNAGALVPMSHRGGMAAALPMRVADGGEGNTALPIQSARMSVPLFFALYCLEAGLFFVIVPWTRVWSMNSFLHATPALMLLSGNPFVRGFVSGFGVAHLLIGVKDVLRIVARRNGGAE
jgi:hypothetical protein